MIWLRLAAAAVAAAGIVSMIALSGPIATCLRPIFHEEARWASCAAATFLADPTGYLAIVLGVAPVGGVAATMLAIALGTRSAFDAVRVGVAGGTGAFLGTLVWALLQDLFPVLFPSRVAFVLGGTALLGIAIWWARHGRQPVPHGQLDRRSPRVLG